METSPTEDLTPSRWTSLRIHWLRDTVPRRLAEVQGSARTIIDHFLGTMRAMHSTKGSGGDDESKDREGGEAPVQDQAQAGRLASHHF